MKVQVDDCVVPNQLCQYCRHFFHVFDRRILEHGLENHWKTETQGFEHLPDVQFLFESADDGCHLCSIFAGRLRDTYRPDQLDALGANSLFLELKKSTQPDLSTRRYALELYSWEEISRLSSDPRPLVTTHVELCNIENIAAIEASREPGHSFTGSSHEAQDGHGLSFDFDYNLRLIKSWIGQCTAAHGDCRISSRLPRPTRLLDLEPKERPSRIRVVDGTATGDALYATLSYRWGSRLPLMLLPSNLELLKTGLLYDSLPKTFKDAISVCHELGIRYLWVDALCIIQGPSGDFETEAARMESIYAGSFITIAAAEAADSWEGFIVERDSLKQDDCWHQLRQSRIRVKISSGVQRKYFGEYALDGRGWVFQERLFSPRSLYFSPHGVEWECRRSTTITDRFVPSEDIYVMGQLSKRLYGQLTQIERLRRPRDLAFFHRLWNDVLMQYTRTSLTYATDKLPALAGVAAVAEGRFEIKASFGLWLRGFTNELLWITQDDDPGRRSTRVPGRAPTWSWASIEGPVEKHHITGSYELSTKEGGYTAKVVVAPPPTSFTKPPLVWMPIKLRASMVPCIFQNSDMPWLPRFDGSVTELIETTTAYVDEHGIYRMRSFHGDIVLEDNQHLMCLLVKRVMYSEQRGSSESPRTQDTKVAVEDAGLVLAPTGVHCYQYERVGLYNESAEVRISQWRKDIAAARWSALFVQLTRGLRMFPAKTTIREKSVEIV